MSAAAAWLRAAWPTTGPLPSRALRRAAIGLVAGLLASVALAPTLRLGATAVALAAFVGLGYGLAFRFPRRAYVDGMMTGSALGIPLCAPGLVNISSPSLPLAGFQPSISGRFARPRGCLVAECRGTAFRGP